MRPVELRLRNFRSYFGETTLSFRERRLLGIVGPIGSGKSSILDGIAYGLFGKTPTVARSTKTLIHQRADDAAVALRFEVGDSLYEVVRSMRRRGQSQHALYRLDADSDEPAQLERLTGEAEVNQRVVELIGLEFDAFSRSVLLAQGRFAEFLRSPPRERDAVLKGVFGHDRIDAMREVAKERGRQAEADAEKVAFQVQQLEEKSRRLVEARAELVEREQRVAALDKAEPELQALDERLQATREELAEIGRRRTVLESVAEGLPDATSTNEQLAAVETASQRREQAAADLGDATTSADKAQSALVIVEESRGDLEKAGDLVAQLEARRAALKAAREAHAQTTGNLATVTGSLATAGDDLTTLQSTAEQATAAMDEARSDVVAARTAVHQAEHVDMAAAIRSELTSGSVCPVCEQDIQKVPPVKSGSEVTTARAALETAEKSAADAEKTSKAAAADLAKAEAALAGLTADKERLQEAETAAVAKVESEAAACASLESDLAKLLSEKEDFAKVLESRRQTAAAAVAAASEARKRADAARATLDEAVAAEQAAAAAVSSLEVAIAQLAGRLEVDAGDESVGLRDKLEVLRSSWSEESQRLSAAAKQHQLDTETITTERVGILSELGVATSLAEELGSERARTEERRAEITRIETELAAGEGLVDERDRLVLRRDSLQRLASDLTDSRFIRYLLDEERAELADLGSEHLMRLTSGRYRFDDSGSFDIVDLTAADAIRKADSLSGGETFLASLGLALALAEMVARTGGRLESFFLDEGFGSLDPEHLDLAMEGIEALASDDAERLVVVVSHVPEMRHRIEDLIELDRSPTTGDTKVVKA